MIPTTLNGKKITSVKVSGDKSAIAFLCDDAQQLIAKCHGEVGSRTWVESVSLPAGGYPFTIITISGGSMSTEGNLTIYEAQVETDSGVLVIDYRNEAEDCYGGSIEWPGSDHFYASTPEQDEAIGGWTDIK